MADDNTTDVLRKADAFISRSRVFVAGTAPQAPPAKPIEDDVPVLTDVVAAHEFELATAPPHMQQHLEALRWHLEATDIRASIGYLPSIRLVTHLDIDDAAIDRTISAFQEFKP